MKKRTANKLLILSLAAAALLSGVTHAETQRAKSAVNKDHMPVAEFKSMLVNNESDAVVRTLGLPDTIISAKDAKDKPVGVVWVYKNAVSDSKETMDVRFLMIEGKLKMYSLSKGT